MVAGSRSQGGCNAFVIPQRHYALHLMDSGGAGVAQVYKVRYIVNNGDAGCKFDKEETFRWRQPPITTTITVPRSS